MTLSLVPARPGRHPQSVFVRLADILVGHDVVEDDGDDVPLLVADAVLRVGVLADHAVQAAVGHLGVARAGQVHRQHLLLVVRVLWNARHEFL